MTLICEELFLFTLILTRFIFLKKNSDTNRIRPSLFTADCGDGARVAGGGSGEANTKQNREAKGKYQQNREDIQEIVERRETFVADLYSYATNSTCSSEWHSDDD